jgi:hypothetical protein
LLSGILSRPASPLSSLPPEDEVPLPLGFERAAVPVVGESAFGLAELAAGSQVTAPRPLGAPPWAKAAPESNMTISAASPAFMSFSLYARANREARCSIPKQAPRGPEAVDVVSFRNHVEPIQRIEVISIGLSKTGSISSRRHLGA